MKVTTALVAFTLSLALVFAGCTSSTVIRSNVPGARVFLNGEYVGNTPYTMSDTKIVGSTTQVRIEAPGYAPTVASISRSEEFSVGACIGGVFFLVPFLWIMDYKADHFYQMAPAGAQQPAGYPAPAPAGYPAPAPAPAPYPAPAPAPTPYSASK
mgnify:CR=1 FL=1|jgi:hypothetical protein